MSLLPPYILPTPSIVDKLQYPAGSLVGLDVGTDKWDVVPSSLGVAGMQCALVSTQSAAWVVSDPSDDPLGTADVKALAGGFDVAACKINPTISPNQWALGQCIIPLDSPHGVFPAVRVNTDSGDCYWASNWGDFDYQVMTVQVFGRKNGLEFTIPLSFSWEGLVNQLYIDGVLITDGFITMLEVAGNDPVVLRLSVILPRTGYHEGFTGPVREGGNSWITDFPSEVSPGLTMPHAYEFTAEYLHYGPNRIITGLPGLKARNVWLAGGLTNFNAGEIAGFTDTSDTTAPTISAFTIPSTSSNLTVAVTSLTATDDVAVTGYLLTESATAPLAADAGWTSTAPTSYTFSTSGSKTLYAWAKDEAGNVSSGMSAGVTISTNNITDLNGNPITMHDLNGNAITSTPLAG